MRKRRDFDRLSPSSRQQSTTATKYDISIKLIRSKKSYKTHHQASGSLIPNIRPDSLLMIPTPFITNTCVRIKNILY